MWFTPLTPPPAASLGIRTRLPSWSHPPALSSNTLPFRVLCRKYLRRLDVVGDPFAGPPRQCTVIPGRYARENNFVPFTSLTGLRYNPHLQAQGRDFVAGAGCAEAPDVLGCIYGLSARAAIKATPSAWDPQFAGFHRKPVFVQPAGEVIVDGSTVTKVRTSMHDVLGLRITCGLSRVGYHVWVVTCGLSRVGCHVGLPARCGSRVVTRT